MKSSPRIPDKKPARTAPARTETEIVKVEYSPLELNKAEAAAKKDLEKFRTFTIDNDDDLAFANEAFEERRLTIKAVNAGFAKLEAPFKKALKRFQALRLPTTKALGETVMLLKGEIGRYQLAQLQEQQAAYSEVAEQVEELAPEELSEALEVAQEAGPRKLAGTSTGFRWTVKRVVFGLLDDKYKLFDKGLIERDGAAQNTGVEEAPIIPGVIWELEPVVRATGRG